MNQLCRHILPAGRHCTQPAVKKTLYCRHHQVIKRALAQVEPKPDPYGIYTPLPFVFPEDRAALQINYMLVAQALNDRSINLQMANAFNRIFRSCEINLKHGPLTEPSPKSRTKNSTHDQNYDQDYDPASDPNIVQRVILTPEGEEIATRREVLEEGEPEPTHGKECPCQVCAEEFRGVPPEEHHEDCKCGICEEIIDEPSINESHPEQAPNGCHSERSEEPAVLQPATNPGSENSALPVSDAPEGAKSMRLDGKSRVCLDGQSPSHQTTRANEPPNN